ncbi:HAD family hydrolase [Aquibacillus sediminis]|uniref:HAD family hydrolase n=1 Tax=Aquibacillus sediminis TaxID=2574734 RepID=UPI001109BF2B|nr:HAD family hydrolase [Aquibacillus sediminis]
MDSVIFDLDGTLWDSRQAVADAWNHVLKQKQINKQISVDDLQKTMGLPFDEVAMKLLPNIDQQKREQILEKCGELENGYLRKQGGKLYPQVEKVLETLSEKYKLFIVSNCQDGYIEAFFAYHQLGSYFIDYEHPGRTGLSKGENIQLVIDRNQLTNPIYVGDTDGDQKAATFAGIPFVYAKYGFGEVKQYDYVIDQFNALPEII